MGEMLESKGFKLISEIEYTECNNIQSVILVIEGLLLENIDFFVPTKQSVIFSNMIIKNRFIYFSLSLPNTKYKFLFFYKPV